MVVASFVFFLLVFVGIGLLSAFKSRGNNEDYLVASSSVQPWLVALSAVATNNSGYMFIGMIGFTYTVGLSSIWIMIGWIFGDFVASQYIHKRLRVATEKHELISFGGVLSRWHGTNYEKLRLIVGIITLLFLGTYAGAQLKAGSKALHVLFNWDYSTGAIIGAVMVFLYCMAGGIRASIWTDAAQSFVMIIAMGMLLLVGVNEVGGIGQFATALGEVSSTYTNLFPEKLATPGFTGASLFVIGWVFAGFGVVGQPHIMVRFMTLDDAENINRVRAYYYSWFIAFYAMTIGVGLLARLLIPASSEFDAELALPMISLQLLPAVAVGVVLAGLFAATMSTADSLILSCSASLTRDIVPKLRDNYYVTKGATVTVTLIALYIALFGTENVFNLVLIAWSVLAGAFGPLLLVYSLGRKVSEITGIGMVLTGFTTTILWRQLGLGDYIYEIAPGLIAGITVYFIFNLIGFNRLSEQAIQDIKDNA